MSIKIFDPYFYQKSEPFRGNGRILQLLHENLTEETNFRVEFVPDLSSVNDDDTLFVPIWSPFQSPLLTNRIARKQILMIFDVIPLKYSKHFPSGISGHIKLWKNKIALKNYDSFVTISEHSKQDLVHHLGISPDKIQVVYPTYSKIFAETSKSEHHHTEILKKFGVEPGKFVLYVGDANWNKNIVTLAKALKIAHMRCIFVGHVFSEEHSDMNHPWLRELKQFKSEISLSLMRFPGFVPDSELKTLYQRALCNMLVSHDEGFGMSYLEAATQKCASILSDIPVFHEIALSSARFVTHTDPQDIAQALDELQGSEQLVRYIGDEAYRRSKAFAPEVFVKELLKKDPESLKTPRG